jgi:hypothetical protein
MAGMNALYLNAMRDAGKAVITYINVVNSSGLEISTRKAVTWVNDGDGVMRPSADLVFIIPVGETVAGWNGYSASSGGNLYGGRNVPSEPYPNGGEYTLLANLTAIQHTSP